MKKFTVLMLAALLVVAFTVPTYAAVENIFGGYWRTRMFQLRNFAGDDTRNLEESRDAVLVDTRTRLFYTAKINDKLKFVNAFEMDSIWGSAVTYGRTGTDSISVEVKHSYADFNVGPVNFIVGAQPFSLARGFISGEDGVGMKVIWKINDGLYLPFIWSKMAEGNQNFATGAGLAGEDFTRLDIDMYVFTPIIMLSKDIKINPYYVFLHSQDAFLFQNTAAGSATLITANSFNNLNAHVFGLDFDAKFGPASLWFTGVLQTGSAVATGTAATTTAGLTAGKEVDLEGYLVNLGGKFDFGKGDVHGNFIYASGEDKGLTDYELNAFLGTSAQIYTWSEILGSGVVDFSVPVGTNATGAVNKVSNIMAIGVGATVKPMDKLAITADLWYAELAEKNAFNEDELGLEVNLKATYKLVEGLNLDVIAAYLFAGDAISADGKNENDPYELVTQLSLSF